MGSQNSDLVLPPEQGQKKVPGTFSETGPNQAICYGNKPRTKKYRFRFWMVPVGSCSGKGAIVYEKQTIDIHHKDSDITMNKSPDISAFLTSSRASAEDTDVRKQSL